MTTTKTEQLDQAQHNDADSRIIITKDNQRVIVRLSERTPAGSWGLGGINVTRETAGKLYAVLGKFLGMTLLVLGLVGCLGDDESLPDATDLPDAEIVEPDAAELPRCADVGCPTAAFCNAAGCCTCNATGMPVACLSAAAEPDACEPAADAEPARGDAATIDCPYVCPPDQVAACTWDGMTCDCHCEPS